MKYIIFRQDDTELKEPVIFGDHTVHSAVNIECATAVSAGYFIIDNDGFVSTYGDAQSIGLKPADGDETLMEYVLQNMGTVYFLDL